MARWWREYADFSPRQAERLAEFVHAHRMDERLETTQGFIDMLRQAKIYYKKFPVVFQAIRIAVNKELDHVQELLNSLPQILAKKGRAAFITFHSIEDRLVKYRSKDLEKTHDIRRVNKKVIRPHYTEVQHNKAARSAKLRILERV